MNNKIKKTALTTVVSLVGLANLLASSPSPAATSAQSAAAQLRGDRIEGVWDSQVTITDCTTGNVLVTFRGLGLFARGGANTQTNNQPPGLASPGFGRWDNLGGGHYLATLRFFAFANGVFTGVQRVARDIQLDPGAATFSSVISTEFFDPNGNLVGTGCGLEAATRVE